MSKVKQGILHYFSKYPSLKRQIIGILLGNIFMGFAMALLRLSLFGNDPMTCMNLGYHNTFGLSLGNIVIIFNLIIVIPVLYWARHLIQFGSLINMLLCGYICDFFYFILVGVFGTSEPTDLAFRVALLVTGLLTSSFGLSLYMCANMGIGPYDAYALIINEKTHGKVSFRVARILQDCISVVLGFVQGSIVSIGTLSVAAFTGPLASFFISKIVDPWMYPDKKSA